MMNPWLLVRMHENTPYEVRVKTVECIRAGEAISDNMGPVHTDGGSHDTEGRDNLVNFIDEYMARKAMHVQFNVMSSATMRAAQKKPEDYKDMLVRVAGYSAYFVELGKPLQKDLIQRTELHF